MSKGKANERINSQMTPAKSKNSTTTYVVVIAGVVILILAAVILYQIFKNAEEAGARNTVVTPENVEAIVAELSEREYTPPGSFEVSMPVVWNFPDGLSASSDAFVDNVVNNTNTVYFTIVLESAQEDEIYHSPYIEVGGRLTDIKLDMILEAGTHKAILTYYLVDEAFNDLSMVSVNVDLVVAN